MQGTQASWPAGQVGSSRARSWDTQWGHVDSPPCRQRWGVGGGRGVSSTQTQTLMFTHIHDTRDTHAQRHRCAHATHSSRGMHRDTRVHVPH